MQEFLSNGYAATSMDRVAAAAGVSKATVYSHFQDKASLFAALIQKLAADKFRATSFDFHADNAATGDPKVVLSQLAQELLKDTYRDSQACEFMRLMVGESGRFPELAEPYIANVAKPIIDGLSRYLASHPELALSDPEATARLFLGTLVYFIMLQRVLQGADMMPMEGDRLITTLVDLITSSEKK